MIVKEHLNNLDFQLLHEADVRTSHYKRLLPLSTHRHKLVPINTQLLTHQLEQATHYSLYNLYLMIYQSKILNQLTTSKAHPIEKLRNHLLSITNCVLFLVRTHTAVPLPVSVVLVGQLGATPDSVETLNPRTRDEPSLRGDDRATRHTFGSRDATSGFGGFAP